MNTFHNKFRLGFTTVFIQKDFHQQNVTFSSPLSQSLEMPQYAVNGSIGLKWQGGSPRLTRLCLQTCRGEEGGNTL